LSDEPALSEVQSFEVDLTRKGPDGLDGTARVYILGHEDRFNLEVVLEDDEMNHSEETGEDLRSKLHHRFAHVEHEHRDFTVKDGLAQSYSVSARSAGRWSQQGISVPYPIFQEVTTPFEKSSSRPHAPFPLPVSYDLDLTGDFSLPLSADRKSILPSSEANEVLRRVSGALAAALFETLGNATVRNNQEFFESVADLHADESYVFKEALARFLGA